MRVSTVADIASMFLTGRELSQLSVNSPPPTDNFTLHLSPNRGGGGWHVPQLNITGRLDPNLEIPRNSFFLGDNSLNHHRFRVFRDGSFVITATICGLARPFFSSAYELKLVTDGECIAQLADAYRVEPNFDIFAKDPTGYVEGRRAQGQFLFLPPGMRIKANSVKMNGVPIKHRELHVPASGHLLFSPSFLRLLSN